MLSSLVFTHGHKDIHTSNPNFLNLFFLAKGSLILFIFLFTPDPPQIINGCPLRTSCTVLLLKSTLKSPSVLVMCFYLSVCRSRKVWGYSSIKCFMDPAASIYTQLSFKLWESWRLLLDDYITEWGQNCHWNRGLRTGGRCWLHLDW